METMTLEELRAELRTKRARYETLARRRQGLMDQLQNHRETCRAVESVVRDFKHGSISVMCISNVERVERQLNLVNRAMALIMELMTRLVKRIDELEK